MKIPLSKVKIEVPSSENREKVIPKSESYIRPGYSQYLESRRHSIDLNDNVEETSVWRPDISNRGNRGNVDIGSRRNRESVIFGEAGIGLARSRYSRHMPTVEEIAREIQDRGYTASSGTFIPCRENSAFRPCRSEIGYSTRSRRQNMDCHSGYEGENPLRDPYMLPEGPGLGSRNGTFVAREQGPGFHKIKDTRRMRQETFTQPVSVNSEYNMDSRDSTRLFNNPPVVQTNHCRNDRETNFHEKQPYRKQKEPDKYDGEKVEWQDFQVHFETVATWNGWTETEKGLQLATCLRGKAQKVLSELKPSQKSDYYTLTSVLAKRFNPPHRENAFRAVFRQRKRQPKESLMDYGCEVSRLAQKAYPEFPYEALDQVSREQFVRVYRNPTSLEEAVSLATQFESFELGEGNNPGMVRGETRPPKNRTAPIRNEELDNTGMKEELASLCKQLDARDAKAEKIIEDMEVKLSKLSQQVETASIKEEFEGKFNKLSEQVEQLTKLNLSRLPTIESNRQNHPWYTRNQGYTRGTPKGNCFGCGQPGHYRNSCPKLRQRERPDSPSERQGSSKNKPSSKRVTNLKGGWLVPGTIQGVNVEMLVDSGSDVTLVDSRFYENIPAAARPKLNPSDCSLTTASGSPMTPVGEAHLHLKLGTQAWSYPFIISELGSTNAIIGNDFLRENGCFLDMRLGLLGIKNEKLLLRTEQTTACCRVRLAETVAIRPNHEVRLPGIIDKPREGSVTSHQGLVQPVKSLIEDTGLFMGTSLVDTTKTLVPVTLLNLGEETKHLPRVLEVGVVEQVESGVVEENKSNPIVQLPGNKVKHLAEMLNRMGSNLSTEQAEQVKDVIMEYSDVFTVPDGELGHTTLVQHEIDTGNHQPIKQPPRRLPQAQREIADKEVEKMLSKGFIETSDSPWASPIVLVAKKDGSTRFCIDYRRLNDVTRKDSFPLPRIDETIESLAGAEWFSTLDLASGYWQVSVAHRDRAKTAFATRKGLFQWKVMPFGLANAPATFSRLMEMVLRGLNWERCLVYLNDIIVFGKSFEEALANLVQVFERLRKAGLKLKPSKCSLFQTSVKFLGHVVSKEGVACDPDKIDCVRDWETPKCVTEVRSFVGFASL